MKKLVLTLVLAGCCHLGAEGLPSPYIESAWLTERAKALAAELPTKLEFERNWLDSFETRAKKTFEDATKSIVCERVLKRVWMAKDTCDFVERNLKAGDSSSLQYAERAMNDLQKAREYFEKELELWKLNPDNPKVRPVVLNGADYGIVGDGKTSANPGFRKAFAAIRALGGRPCVLKLPEGEILMTEREFDEATAMKAQFLCRDLTNCVITGVSPEKTRIVYGVYDEVGTRVNRCLNTKFANFQTYWRVTPFAEGFVTEVDVGEGSCVIEANPKGLRFDDPRIKSQLFCQWTIEGKQCFDSSFTWMDINRPAQNLGGNRYRVFFNREKFGESYKHVKPQRFISIGNRVSYEGFCVFVSDFVTLEDLWCRNSRSSAFSGSGQLTMNRCKVFPNEGFMLSSNADGFFTGPGSYLAHSTLTRMHDDGNNSHTYGTYVVDNIDSRTFAYNLGNVRCPKPGELMLFASPLDGRFLGNVRVESAFKTNVTGKGWMAYVTVESMPPGVESFGSLGMKAMTKEEQQEIVFGRKKVDRMPTHVYLQGQGGVMTVVTDSTISSLRGTGIPVQAPNELIENTIIENVSQGLHLCGLSQWMEGPPPYHTVVRDLTIKDCGSAMRTQFKMPNHGPGASATIRGCRFERLKVVGADGVGAELKNLGDSVFENCSFEGPRSAVTQINCEGVVFRDCESLGREAKMTPPYGICAHLTRSESSPKLLEANLDAMKVLGVGTVRCDFDPYSIPVSNGVRDYSKYDAILDKLEKVGLRMLPILRGYDHEGGGEKTSDLVVYSNYVTEVVSHFKNRLPVWEIFNEANLNSFFPGADPVRYASVLRTAYNAIKAVDPALRVAFTGTAGVPVDWIRKAFAAGAVGYFDIMNVHPYTHPRRPEEILAKHISDVRSVMDEFGCADKPLWFTEIGWPTHIQQIQHSHVLTAGLKVARPEQKSWRVLIAAKETEASRVSHALEDRLLDILPVGSFARAFSQPETVLELATNNWDAVFYPLDDTFPSDTVAAVNDFIRKGGVLIDMGGLPGYYGFRDDVGISADSDGRAVSRFPFDYQAWWHHDDAVDVSRNTIATYATKVGLEAGVKQEPTGFQSKHFVTTRRDAEPCEFIPLVAGVSSNGHELVSAAVIRYSGERKGAVVLSTLPPPRGVIGTNDERNQAAYTARALGISFAENVESYFLYNLRATEVDPYYSERHFGIMHANFQPKPAYSAYMTFIRERPEGSKQLKRTWQSGDVYCPCWTRPNGSAGGMIWTKAEPVKRTLTFSQGVPEFVNMYGLRIMPRQISDNEYLVEVTGDPIYFHGAELSKIRKP